MHSSSRLVHRLAVLSLIALQVSCGSDSSGPGNGATTITANSSTALSAAPGAQVTERPSVILRDQSGAPVAGVEVTFAATTGGGTVTGGSQVTDAQGIATVGSWTLGTVLGNNTLVASSGTLPTVTFNAFAGDPCTTIAPLQFGTNSSGSLATTDCMLSDGSFIDFYETTIPAAGTYLFTQSATFDTFLALYGATGVLLGVNDDIAANNQNSAIKAILPAGTFRLGTSSWRANTTGNYTFSSAASTAVVTNCEEVFVVKGASTTQSLQTTDCPNTTSGYSDDYLFLLAAGQTVTITMTSSAVDSFLELYSAPNARAAFNDNSAAGSNDARITYTATGSSFFLIRATTPTTGSVGAYSLTIE